LRGGKGNGSGKVNKVVQAGEREKRGKFEVGKVTVVDSREKEKEKKKKKERENYFGKKKRIEKEKRDD